jgi:hypothetical protein
MIDGKMRYELQLQQYDRGAYGGLIDARFVRTVDDVIVRRA